MWYKANHTQEATNVQPENPTKAVRIAKQVVEIFGTVIEQWLMVEQKILLLKFLQNYEKQTIQS